MRRSVSSPDETLRRELKIRRAAEYFWRTSRCFIWWWNTVSNAWYYFSNKMILEGEINDAKMSSFSFDFQTLIKRWFPLYFLYELLVWEVTVKHLKALMKALLVISSNCSALLENSWKQISLRISSVPFFFPDGERLKAVHSTVCKRSGRFHSIFG